MSSFLITSIDIGLVAMGICLAKVDSKTLTIKKLLRYENINLIHLTSKTCKALKCVYQNQNTISHYIHHFFKKFRYIYFNEKIRVILVERQPITFFSSIEQLIQFKYPNRVKLVSPTTLGKYLGTLGLERAEKKRISIENAKKNFSEEQLQTITLIHDFCDAINYIEIYLLDQKNKQESTVFDQFRYSE